MAASGVLVTLYPTDGTNGACTKTNAIVLTETATTTERAKVINTKPTSPSLHTESLDRSVTSLSDYSSNLETPLSIRVAPFLEMEREEDEDGHQYDDGMLEDVPLNDLDDTTNSTTVERHQSPQDEKSSENQIDPNAESAIGVGMASITQVSLSAHDNFVLKSSSINTNNSSPSSSCASVRSCGKRPRNHRRVTFPPTRLSLEQSMNETDRRKLEKSRHQIRDAPSLVQVRDTIHRADYSPEERFSTWYALSDLRAFKRERKETARRIDIGLLSLPPFSTESVKIVPHQSTLGGDSSSSISIGTESPIEYCARGCENCTEAIGRLRYRHIADGWRIVLNMQEKHHYEQKKMASMTVEEKNQFRSLASFLNGGSKKTQRTSAPWSFSNPTNTDGDQQVKNGLCCPYKIAAAYKPISMASLEIARYRAIGDEREVANQQEHTEVHSFQCRRGTKETNRYDDSATKDQRIPNANELNSDPAQQRVADESICNVRMRNAIEKPKNSMILDL